MSLTKRQSDVLGVIRRRLAQSEVGPNYEEIAAELGIVKSGVARLMVGLKERGYVDWIPRKARSIRLLEKR